MPQLKRPRGTTRKIAAARIAVSRANAVLKARSAMSSGSYGPPASRGFYNFGGGRNELKYIDLQGVNIALTTAGTVTLINACAAGTDVINRVGRKICMKSLLWCCNNFPVAAVSNALQGVMIRQMIIYDSQPNSAGTVPAVTDILESATTLSAMNLNNRDRFKVIYDKRSQIGSFNIGAGPALIAGSPQNVFWKKYRKLNHDVIFSGTGATIGNISTGALYLLAIADFNLVALTDFFTRVRFSDA